MGDPQTYQTMRHFSHRMGPRSMSTQHAQQVMEPALSPLLRTL
jgi:hypothetical protein